MGLVAPHLPCALLKVITGIYNLAFDCTGILGGRHSSPRNKMVAGAVPKSTGSGMSCGVSEVRATTHELVYGDGTNHGVVVNRMQSAEPELLVSLRRRTGLTSRPRVLLNSCSTGDNDSTVTSRFNSPERSFESAKLQSPSRTLMNALRQASTARATSLRESGRTAS